MGDLADTGRQVLERDAEHDGDHGAEGNDQVAAETLLGLGLPLDLPEGQGLGQRRAFLRPPGPQPRRSDPSMGVLEQGGGHRAHQRDGGGGVLDGR